MSVSRLNNELTRLRQLRNRADPDLSLGAPLQNVCRDLERRSRAAGGIGDAWARILPLHLAEAADIVSFTRGVLTIRPANAAIRYQLDCFLRAGGEAELARAARTSIRRIRLL